MLRTLLTAVAAVATICLAAPAQAAPKLCDGHGVGHGHIYKTACGSNHVGNGGGMYRVWDPEAKKYIHVRGSNEAFRHPKFSPEDSPLPHHPRPPRPRLHH